jgi:hypothetical protein
MCKLRSLAKKSPIPETPDEDFTQNYGSKFETWIANDGPRVTLPWPGIVVNMSFGTAVPLKHPKTRGRSCLSARHRQISGLLRVQHACGHRHCRRVTSPWGSRHCHDVQRASIVDSDTSVELLGRAARWPLLEGNITRIHWSLCVNYYCFRTKIVYIVVTHSSMSN